MSQIIKKIMSIAIITAMVIMNFNCTILTTNAQEKDEYIVITKTDKAAEKIEDKYNVETDEALNGADNVLSGTLTEAQAEKLEDMKNVEVVEKDFTFEDSTEEDILPEVKPADDNWANKIVEATNTEQTGKKIKICIIDSGVDMTENFEIAERIDFISENYGEETSEEYLEEIENPNNEDIDEYEDDPELEGYDEDYENTDLEDEYEMTGTLPLFDDTCGHGTSIASVIAGTGTGSDVEGIAPNAELYSAKILDENREAPVSRAIKAIYWAIDKGMDIINLSFGTTTYSAALEQAVNDAADAGILVVASVGNNGNDGIDYPARCESTLSVGAINAAGEVCDFSSKGDKVDVVAPGEAITAQANFGEDMTLTGTSLATPYVTAIAADLWSKDTSKPAGFIKELIKASGKTITSSDGHEDKLIDYNYANEIYDEAYQAYLEKTGKVEENTENVSIDENTSNNENPDIEDENASVDEVVSENVQMKEISSNEDETTPDTDKIEDEKQNSTEAKEEVIEDEDDGSNIVNENNQEEIKEIDLTEEIEENTEEPQEELAEDVVKGSWKEEIHTKHVSNSIMKNGALFPDNLNKKEDIIAGMKNHPSFHGYAGSTDLNKGKNNFIAAYRWLAYKAMHYKNGTKIANNSNAGLTDGQKKDISNFWNKLTNDKLKGDAKGFSDWSNSKKGSFVMGIAMHTAADAFAHSAFKKNNGKWGRITHPDADNVAVNSNRDNMAIHVEKQIKDRFENKRTGIGYGNDLCDLSMNGNYKFRINNFRTFAVDANVQNKTCLAWFGKMCKK